MADSDGRIKVAICGGGIAAICLAYGLLKHEHLEVKIFEANEILREDGAAVGLGGNAQQALELLGSPMRAALDKAGGTPMNPSVRFMMGTGERAGELIHDLRPSKPQIVVHRGPFIRQLRALLSDSLLQLGKKLKAIVPVPYGNLVELEFEDGTSHRCHAVIGCDGINSSVRSSILGAENPATKPIYTGGYAFRTVIPIEKAAGIFGREYVAQQTQHAWVGQGGFHLTDLVDNASAMQVIAGWSSKGPWPYDAPFVAWSKERFVNEMQGWDAIGSAMIKVFTSQETLYAAGGRRHQSTPTYAKDNMCIVGDAAHAMAPFLGAGAGQAIEDAVILSACLGTIKNAAQVPAAFRAYDQVRRPRRTRIAELSTAAAILETGGRPDVGMDIEKMRTALQGVGVEAYEHKLEPDILKALSLVHES